MNVFDKYTKYSKLISDADNIKDEIINDLEVIYKNLKFKHRPSSLNDIRITKRILDPNLYGPFAGVEVIEVWESGYGDSEYSHYEAFPVYVLTDKNYATKYFQDIKDWNEAYKKGQLQIQIDAQRGTKNLKRKNTKD